MGFSQLGSLDFCRNASSLPLGFSFMLDVQPELPLVAHPLSTSGDFSKRTLCPSLMCLPILVHVAEIQAIFSVCRPDNRDPKSLLYWFRVQLIRWWRSPPVGPNMEGCGSGLGRSLVMPPFSWSEWFEGTSPAESGGSVASLPPILGILPETCVKVQNMVYGIEWLLDVL